MSELILPGTLEWVLATRDTPLPPGAMDEVHRSGGQGAFICPLGQQGLMEWVPMSRALEYMHDGELDHRMDEIEEYEADCDLWLPGDPLEV